MHKLTGSLTFVRHTMRMQCLANEASPSTYSLTDLLLTTFVCYLTVLMTSNLSNKLIPSGSNAVFLWFDGCVHSCSPFTFVSFRDDRASALAVSQFF